MDRALRVTLLLCAVAGAATARAGQAAGCDHAISTDVTLSRTDDPDTPYEARILLREERTGAVLPLEYRMSRGLPISATSPARRAACSPP